LYYNTYILNRLYETTTDSQAKEFLLRATPTAWDNINLLGRYQFYGNLVFDLDQWVRNWNWQKGINLVENPRIEVV